MAEQWQEEIRTAITSIAELKDFAFVGDRAVESKFRTLVPRYYLGLINPNDPQDPIAKMAFPQVEELALGALRDPIGDLAKQAAPRLTHRYTDRALLHVTNLCPMYCRFCFRKNLMNEKEEELYAGDFAEAAAYLQKHAEVQELIFTGGDPWMLGDKKLGDLVDLFLTQAPHLKTIRFHTRMPVTLPSRITDGLLNAIRRKGRAQTIVVTHFNHSREISEQARIGVEKLRNAGISVLNQSVLLRGVNDNLTELKALFRGLGNIGVLPYYLHHADLVSGGDHFRTTIKAGQQLWQSLRGELPGYLVPEYVIEIPGGFGKIPVSDAFVKEIKAGHYSLQRGNASVEYQDP